MMTMWYSIVFAVMAAMATPAAAQEDTGNYMLPYCQALVQGKPGDVGMAGVCAGTISALVYVGHALPGAVRFCPPRNTPNGQHQRVVLAYLERNPPSLHLNFKELALNAMREAWPCPRSRDQ
jgi:hypothetical protein